jgi:hypothetical protein
MQHVMLLGLRNTCWLLTCGSLFPLCYVWRRYSGGQLALFWGATGTILGVNSLYSVNIFRLQNKKEILSTITGAGSKEPRRKVFGADSIF